MAVGPRGSEGEVSTGEYIATILVGICAGAIFTITMMLVFGC